MAMSRWRGAVAGLLLIALFNVRGDAQQQAPSQPSQASQQTPQTTPPPVFRTGINFVRVDVIVTDSKTRQPVADLKQGDFVVTEDNKPQTLETFKLIKLDGGIVPGP